MDLTRLRCMAAFALHAVCVGGLFSRIAELQRDAALDAAAFGLVLTGMPVGVLVGTLIVSQMVEALGTRRTMILSFPLFAAMPLLIALAPGPWSFWGGLVAFGLVLALANIPMNVEADRIALATGRPLMLRSHGAWSIGFLLVTAAAALAIRAGITPLMQFAITLGVVLVVVATVIAPMREAPPRAFNRAGRAPRIALPDRQSFVVMGFALAGIVYEGVTRQWSIIYLRDVFGAADWIAALALPCVVATQTAGRFLGDAAIDRFGERALGRALAVIMGAGGLLLVVGGSIPLALVGCALIGLGMSVTHPLASLAVARGGHRPASESVAGFSGLQTLISFTSPVVFGALAATGGLTLAFIAVLPFPILSFFYARVLLPRLASGAPAS